MAPHELREAPRPPRRSGRSAPDSTSGQSPEPKAEGWSAKSHSKKSRHVSLVLTWTCKNYPAKSHSSIQGFRKPSQALNIHVLPLVPQRHAQTLRKASGHWQGQLPSSIFAFCKLYAPRNGDQTSAFRYTLPKRPGTKFGQLERSRDGCKTEGVTSN